MFVNYCKADGWKEPMLSFRNTCEGQVLYKLKFFAQIKFNRKTNIVKMLFKVLFPTIVNSNY